ncbi:MAG: hypothetical protein LBF97_05595 [Elusimicrobiota bacterium]|jgi:hypothetical protein|nr:hypothetical protein [Elusimicrobiota bacterium]
MYTVQYLDKNNKKYFSSKYFLSKSHALDFCYKTNGIIMKNNNLDTVSGYSERMFQDFFIFDSDEFTDNTIIINKNSITTLKHFDSNYLYISLKGLLPYISYNLLKFYKVKKYYIIADKYGFKPIFELKVNHPDLKIIKKAFELNFPEDFAPLPVTKYLDFNIIDAFNRFIQIYPESSKLIYNLYFKNKNVMLSK